MELRNFLNRGNIWMISPKKSPARVIDPKEQIRYPSKSKVITLYIQEITYSNFFTYEKS